MLVEMCIVLLAMSALTLLYLPMSECNEDNSRTFPYTYLEAQARAMAESVHITIQEEGWTVNFNENGNINKAQTIITGRNGKTFISELGGGRLVFP